MSARIWPDVLPVASFPDYGLEPADQSIRTEMEVGARRLRRISHATSDVVSVGWKFTDAEMSAFRAWFADASWSLTGASDDVSDWTQDGVTVTPDIVTGPDAALPDKVVEDGSTGRHAIERAATGALDGEEVQITVTGKPAERDSLRVGLVGRDEVWRWVNVDFSSGVVGDSESLTSIAIEDRDNGWFRAIVQLGAGSGASDPLVRLALLDDTDAVWYTGAGSGGLKVCEINTRVVTGYDLYLRTDADGNAHGAAGGSAWFKVNLAFGGGYREVEARFLQMYKAKPFPGLGWHVTAMLEVRDA